VIGWFIQGRVVEQAARNSAAAHAKEARNNLLPRRRGKVDIARIIATRAG
jgi:hypothetical protein